MRSVLPFLLAFTLSSPSQSQEVPPPEPLVVTEDAPAQTQDPEEARFETWLSTYRAGAIARGLRPEWLDATLAGVTLSPRVVELDRGQPDDSNVRSVFADYRARQINDARILGGQRRLADNAVLLQSIESRYGVPAAVLLAIWGVETSYGGFTGNFDLPRSLATLAFDGRRAELFTRELDAAVRMVGERGVERALLRGSWAGATGQPQFLPSSYLRFAADGDGDGRADIWRSTADTLASIASYFAGSNWRSGRTWGLQVLVPGNLDRERVRNLVQPTSCQRPLSRHSRWISVAEWKALGLQPVGQFPPDDTLMTLVEPDGPGGNAFLTTGNYRAILAYNCSNFYALTVGLLSDAIARPAQPSTSIAAAEAGANASTAPQASPRNPAQ